MKKIIPLIALSAAALLVSVNIKERNYVVRAATLPTNLNLNDVDSDTIRNYYSNLNSLSEDERKGNNLLKNLKPILKNNQKYYSYDGDNLWSMYEITDRDWVKSPASAINGYNPSTNQVTGYKYGTSVSGNKGTNPFIHALYVNRDVDNQTIAWDDHNQTQWGINQEHIWPKSQGFNAKGGDGARGDPMHLWAGNGRVNGTEHNNHPYGYVDKTKEYIDPVTKKGFDNLAGNYQGTSKTLGAGKVFEPQDSDKGDIARAIFYMVARYNDISGDDTINQDNPNLILVQDTPEYASYTSSKSSPGKMGILSDLLEWNKLDPVDEYEIHRNNLLYNNYTNNRNPFIDFPEWADYIWGTSENGVYNPEPTGYASPSVDSINDSNLVVSHSSLSLNVGDTVEISATTADNSDITWTVSDNEVVSLSKNTSSSGEKITVTYLKEGDSTIKAKATVDSTEYEKSIHISKYVEPVPQPEEEPWYKKIDPKILIIGAVALVVIIIIVIVIYLGASKKNKKKMRNAAKKVIKSRSGGSSKGKKK